jgi:hypothetical protein
MTTAQVAKLFGISPRTPAASKRHYGDAMRFINRQFELECGTYLPFEFWPMALGVAWARGTGRLNYQAEFALRALTPYQYIALIVEMANKFSVMGAVPAYLNEKYCEAR